MADAEKKSRRGRRRPQTETPVQDTDAEMIEADYDEVDDGRGLTAKKGRATTGRRSIQEETERRGIVGRTREYLKGVRSELSKVTWPTRPDVVRLARIVLAATIAASIVLGFISAIFTELFVLGLQDPIWFLLFGVGVVVFYVGYTRWSRNRQSSTTFTSRF